jgi:23S rRNA (uridine2552-2'-O)-methyltransferase
MKEVKDFYFFKAKKDNYPARSIYKLEEIDKKYNLIKKGFKILDLGCSPGSWSQYCLEKIGNDGVVVGIDISDVKLTSFSNFTFFKEDIFKLNPEKIKSISQKFDAVISDMAPSTTGIREVDQARSLELVKQAFVMGKQFLKKGGFFICKIFQGPDISAYIKIIESEFEWLKTVKPASSRKESFEIFILGYKFKG